jgi:hypothetical protein
MPPDGNQKGTSMVLYARSDSAAVNGIPDGCGGIHSRPVVNGVPQRPWALNCPPCEDFLRVHMTDQWSSTTVEIPETYDETKAREKAEKSGKLDRENQMANALVELAKLGQLPEAIARALSVAAGPAPVPALTGTLECPAGHAQPAGMKFCGECGEPMSRAAAKAAIPAPRQPAQSTPLRADVKVPRMKDGRVEVLRSFALANALDSTGTQAQLVTRLSNAGLVAHWAGFARPFYAAEAA